MRNRGYEQEYIVKIRRDAATDEVQFEAWRTPDGLLHRQDDLPALASYGLRGGSRESRSWYHMGNLHREGAPAKQNTSTTTGVVLLEVWAIDGHYHRDGDDDPAVIHRDPNTGQTTEERYYTRGVLDRRNGPAVVEFNRDTGGIVHQEFWRNGVPLRNPDAPKPAGPS